MGHFNWKAEQIQCIIEGWRNNVPVPEIAHEAGVSEKRVQMKAAALLLGSHPSYAHLRRREAVLHVAAAQTSSAMSDEGQERAAAIRLHRISFETHRLPGEPESLKVAWR
jgi:hypothetical protein